MKLNVFLSVVKSGKKGVFLIFGDFIKSLYKYLFVLKVFGVFKYGRGVGRDGECLL